MDDSNFTAGTSHQFVAGTEVGADSENSQGSFVFVENWEPASSRGRRGKQGGSYAVRSHISKLTRRKKREAGNASGKSAGKTSSREGDLQDGYSSSDPTRASHNLAVTGQLSVGGNIIEERPSSKPGRKQRTVAIGHSKQAQFKELSRIKFHAKEHARAHSNKLVSVEHFGGGKLDPFAVFPVSNASLYMHDLVDHSIFEIAPQFIADPNVTRTWRSLSLTSPSLFHILVYSGDVHRRAMKTGVFDIEAPVALYHKTLAIQELAKVVHDPKKVVEDDIVFAILILGVHESQSMLGEESSPFDSPLKTGQGLHFYGQIAKANPHMKAMKKIMDLRGGIESCNMFAFAWIVYFCDTTMSTNSMSLPFFPSIPQIKFKIDRIRGWSHLHSPALSLDRGAGFVQYRHDGIHPHMMYLLKSIAALTDAIQTHLEELEMELSMIDIFDGRTAIQHSFLSLPPQSASRNAASSQLSVYEPCRLTTLIYNIAVIFPIPNSRQTLQKLVTELTASLKRTSMLYRRENADLLLWMLVLGGIAALDKPERPWYVAQLAKHAEKEEIADWEDVEDIMLSFLWLSSACNRGGVKLWSEVTERTAALVR